jgi:hypothetical protein
MQPTKQPETHIPGHERRGPEPPPAKLSNTRTDPGAKRPGNADADKRARTGTEKEPVRNTPPFGEWDDTV